MIEYEKWFYGKNKTKRKGKHEGFDCSVRYKGENSNYGTNRLVQLNIVNNHITLQDQYCDCNLYVNCHPLATEAKVRETLSQT